ncbi:MAG: Crp/Fnr family transcriptional regulator [Thermodesulfobacteriota bacterium]
MNSYTEKNEHTHAGEFQENFELLRGVPFFSGLSLECCKVVAYLAVRETVKAGENLFTTGEDDGRAYLFLSGSAELLYESDTGEVAVGTFKTGDFIAGMCLLSPMQRVFTLRARETSTLLVISREKFSKAMESFPHELPRVLKAVVKSIRDWEELFAREHALSCPGCKMRLGVSLL